VVIGVRREVLGELEGPLCGRAPETLPGCKKRTCLRLEPYKWSLTTTARGPNFKKQYIRIGTVCQGLSVSGLGASC
jgi:hypothetical protein